MTNKQLCELSKNEPKLKPTRLIRANTKIKPSTIHGYGVFAKERINWGEIIEECPVLLVSEYVEKIHDFVFNWGDKQNALALGCGSLYNHSENPNANYHMDYEYNLLVFTATRHIEKNEEIFISYGNDWFECRGAKPLELKNPSRRRRTLKLLTIVMLFGILFLLSSGISLVTKPQGAVTPIRFYRDVTSVLQGLRLKNSENSSTAQHK